MKKLLIILVTLIALNLYAQIDYTDHQASYNALEKRFELAKDQNLKEKPINYIFITIAKSFIGIDYEGFVLEKPENETVFCYLNGLDCVSLVENSLALARTIKKDKLTKEDFLKELEYIRYRDGVNKGYTSRAHYYSDWINCNEKKGVMKNISKDLGGNKILTQNISFMTKNRKLYRQIKEDDKAFEEIKNIENELNKREIYYIGKEQIVGNKRLPVLKINDLLQDGDLIALVSKDETMDISHSTIAIKQDGLAYILHASKPGTKVQITEKPIDEYLAGSKNVIGILVARLDEIE